MNPVKKGLEKLEHMIDECYEDHHFIVDVTQESVAIQLVQDKEIVFTGTEIVDANVKRVIYHAKISRGGGNYIFNGNPISNECRRFGDAVENYLQKKEKDNPLKSDMNAASLALSRLLRRAPVLRYMELAYERVERKIDIPKVNVLLELPENKLKEVQAQLEQANSLLESGSDVKIENLEVLHPLLFAKEGMTLYVFDKNLRIYRTGFDGASEFRESLRRLAREE